MKLTGSDAVDFFELMQHPDERQQIGDLNRIIYENPG